MKKRHWEIPSDVTAVYSEITEWRSNRKKRTPVPSEIWSAATGLAQRYGVYRISQTLRLNYGALKRRVVDSMGEASPLTCGNAAAASRCEFIELTGDGMMAGAQPHNTAADPVSRGGGPFQMEIEVSDGAGSRMTVRMLDGSRVDLTDLVSTFWKRPR